MRCELRLEGCWGEASGEHHRQLRRHGDERPVNKLSLCPPCHTYVQTHPAEAYAKGWMVHSWDDPARISWVPA